MDHMGGGDWNSHRDDNKIETGGIVGTDTSQTDGAIDASIASLVLQGGAQRCR
jgi:hypothetical protein